MFTGGHSFQSAQEPPALRRRSGEHFPRCLVRQSGTYSEVRGSYLCSVGRSRQVIHIGVVASAATPPYSRDDAAIRHPDGIRAFDRRTRNTAQIRFPTLGVDPLDPNLVFNALEGEVKRTLQGSTFCPPTVCQDTARDISKASEVSVSHVNSITLERPKCPIAPFKSSWVAA